MTETAEFDIGGEVACSDGPCGELTRVVIDPVERALTHLVVAPRRGQARLVPVEFVEAAGNPVYLTCTKAQFEAFELAEEEQLLPALGRQLGYMPHEVLELPYYYVRSTQHVSEMPLMGEGAQRRAAEHDRVPPGEVEIRRGEHVHATDGAIGRVEGLVVDPADHRVTHFLLQEGHLWGQKTVAIPIGAVDSVHDGVRLTIMKDQVRDLPAVDVARPPADSRRPA